MKLFLNFLIALAISLLSLASFDAWSGEAAAETISYAEAIAIAEANFDGDRRTSSEQLGEVGDFRLSPTKNSKNGELARSRRVALSTVDPPHVGIRSDSTRFGHYFSARLAVVRSWSGPRNGGGNCKGKG